MYVQVIEGHVADKEGLRTQLDRWQKRAEAGAGGYLGTTAGVAEDGSFIGVVRFQSEESETAHSHRPEQGEWCEAFSANLDGEVTFTNCPDVDTFGAGGSDDAGFVQVMKGRADRDALATWPRRPSPPEPLPARRDRRHGGLAGRRVLRPVIYFTSEPRPGPGSSASPPKTSARPGSA